jgi:WD40 repeat protein
MQFDAHEKGATVYSLIAAKEYVLSAASDGTIHVWDKVCKTRGCLVLLLLFSFLQIER